MSAPRTYRQKRAGRLGFVYAWLNPAREVRDLRADLAVLRMKHNVECLEHEMTKGDIGRVQSQLDVSRDEAKQLTIKLLRERRHVVDLRAANAVLEHAVQRLEALVDEAASSVRQIHGEEPPLCTECTNYYGKPTYCVPAPGHTSAKATT